MGKNKSNNTINGTFGNVWVNGEIWAECKSFEAKITGDWEDINFAGDTATHKKFKGFSGEGTITLTKMYSRGANLLATAFKTGVMPDVKIVGKLADPAALGAERIVLEEVTFNEFTLMKFENKTITEDELPFAFADYTPIDLI